MQLLATSGGGQVVTVVADRARTYANEVEGSEDGAVTETRIDPERLDLL